MQPGWQFMGVLQGKVAAFETSRVKALDFQCSCLLHLAVGRVFQKMYSKKLPVFFFFFEFPSGKKQRWLPGCVLHGCTGQRTTSSWWSFSDRLSFLPDRGFGVSWWITIFPLPTWTESWSVKNQATWERCPCFLGWGGGSNAFPCFTSSSVLFWKESEEVDRIRPGVAVRLRLVAPFFAAPPWFFWLWFLFPRSSVNGQGRKHETGQFVEWIDNFHRVDERWKGHCLVVLQHFWKKSCHVIMIFLC